MDSDLVDNFVAITGADEQVARQLLEIANGDISQAVVFYYDTDMAETLRRQPVASSTTASGAATTSQRQIGHEDDDGVIHIDSDDDDDENYRPNQISDTHMAEAATVARTAQEEEDEAMAKRLQQEMYSETAETSDGIRAPMGRTTEMLVEPSYTGGYGDYSDAGMSVYPRRRPARGPPNPFNQVWEDNTSTPLLPDSDAASTGPQPSRQARLAELFRPPYDLIDNFSWEEARSVGKEDKKWIINNIQDMSDFLCQALNRDIWKDEAVKQLVQENFIFLQYSKDDPAAEAYIQYYMPGGQHENPDNYPHVAIIDPRTGEQVKLWSGRPFPTAIEFHAQLAEFLDRYSLDGSRKNPVQRTKPKAAPKDVGRMTEEEMLEMALQNSLETGNGSSSRPSVHDPDELTAHPQEGDAGKGKGKEGEETAAAEAVGEDSQTAESTASSAFARIASDHPHEEPTNSPATVTRIQFRHPTGRVIRRFAVDDRVERIYEWLKAEPLEGKGGLEFELKVMPQGTDLINELDKTIEEVGLKQATVMIEFIED